MEFKLKRLFKRGVTLTATFALAFTLLTNKELRATQLENSLPVVISNELTSPDHDKVIYIYLSQYNKKSNQELLSPYLGKEVSDIIYSKNPSEERAYHTLSDAIKNVKELREHNSASFANVGLPNLILELRIDTKKRFWLNRVFDFNGRNIFIDSQKSKIEIEIPNEKFSRFIKCGEIYLDFDKYMPGYQQLREFIEKSPRNDIVYVGFESRQEEKLLNGKDIALRHITFIIINHNGKIFKSNEYNQEQFRSANDIFKVITQFFTKITIEPLQFTSDPLLSNHVEIEFSRKLTPLHYRLLQSAVNVKPLISKIIIDSKIESSEIELVERDSIFHRLVLTVEDSKGKMIFTSSELIKNFSEWEKGLIYLFANLINTK